MARSTRLRSGRCGTAARLSDDLLAAAVRVERLGTHGGRRCVERNIRERRGDTDAFDANPEENQRESDQASKSGRHLRV
jgi:hypothetical protein